MSGAQLSPRAGHTGAQCPGEVSVCLDYLRFTLQDMPVEQVQEVLGLEGADWAATKGGRNGYRQGLVCGHVFIWHDGAPGMGVHVEITGQGCREMEARGFVKDWPSYLRVLLGLGAKFSRADGAMDDRSGLLDMERIVQHCQKEGKAGYTSRWKSGEVKRSFGQQEGLKVTFGARVSEAFLRIYDKAKEQALQVGEHWIRAELEFKGDRAHAFVCALASSLSLGPLLSSLLRGYLEFREEDCTRKRRASVCPWWLAFLGGVEKARLVMAKEVRTLAQVREWLARQVAPALALVVHADEGDLSWLLGQVASGKLRWRFWHKALAAAVG